MSPAANSIISEHDRFELDGVTFVPSWDRTSTNEELVLLKSALMVDVYRDLLARHPRPRMVELGISQGGSVALLALLADPTMFVALELSPDRIEGLDHVLETRGLTDRVRPVYGVDQADRARVAAIVDEAFGEASLDLVVDDASHLYPETVASFEVLFPRLVPGGRYVIEDWTSQDIWAAGFYEALHGDPERRALAQAALDASDIKETPVPLSRLAVELSLAMAQSKGAVVSVVIDGDWIVVERGPAELPWEGFTLTSLYRDYHGLLTF